MTAAVLAALSIASGGCGTARNNAPLTISVAASLQNAMQEIAPLWERSHAGPKLTFNFGGSGTLAQQIENGAPVDIFLSAAPKPLDDLAAKGLILPGTRRDLLRNQLVLIAPKDNSTLHSFQDLADAKVKLIALGEPSSVPAGDYGRQVFQVLHLWNIVEPKLILAKDVRQVLTYVETGNADAGIVYATDASESARVRVAATAPEETHKPVIYPVAVIQGSRNADAARTWIAFLTGPEARGAFNRHGFTTISP